MPPGARATPLPLSGRTAQPGSVTVVQTTNPGGESVNTLNSTVSRRVLTRAACPHPNRRRAARDFARDAVARGIKTNLGAVGFQQSLRQAKGQTTVARSYLLPQINAALTGVDQQTDLAALGFWTLHLSVPGFSFPTVIGPYHYFDLRAGVSQSIFDRTQLNNYRAAQENAKSTQFSAQDAHDLVALAVTGTYLQVISSAARVDSARAQSATAQETYKEAVDRHNAGVAARIDVTRSQVEFQTEQQRVISLENDLAKQKIAFARLIGLPPGQQYTLTDTPAVRAARWPSPRGRAGARLCQSRRPESSRIAGTCCGELEACRRSRAPADHFGRRRLRRDRHRSNQFAWNVQRDRVGAPAHIQWKARPRRYRAGGCGAATATRGV